MVLSSLLRWTLASALAFTLCRNAHGVVFAATSATSAVIVLPANTTIKVRPNGTSFITGDIKNGDAIDFIVEDPVIINGWVVVPDGAVARGVIVDYTKSGVQGGLFTQHRVASSLTIAFDWVQLDGGKVRLNNAPVIFYGRPVTVRDYDNLEDIRDVEVPGDAFQTAIRFGVDASTKQSVHVATTARATAVQQASQDGNYLDK